MKLTWLVPVHSWINSIVFGNNRPNRTTDWGKIYHKNQFLEFKSADMAFFWKLFSEAWSFLRVRRQARKVNITFFGGEGEQGTEYSFQVVFSKNTIPSDWNPKNWFWRHIFSHICDSIWPIVSKNNNFHPWVDPHQPCEFHKNRLEFQIRNQDPSKRKRRPPPPNQLTPFWSRGCQNSCWVSFGNILKKKVILYSSCFWIRKRI